MDSKSGFGFQGGYRLPGETARWVVSLLVGGFFPVSGSERSRHRWGTAGFTLIELLNVIAVIGILSGLGVNTFSGYKVRAYDAHSKQALRDMHFFCNAFWIDEYPSKECDLPTIKDPIYGFNQNPDVAANLPPSPYDTFCATAKHSESPNTFTINNKSVISLGPSCGGSADAMLTAYVCSGSFNDPCPTSACDEECTKQKATDRLLAVLDTLPDLMQPTPEEIANAIQGIENRAYTDDPGETPTLHAEGMVDELVAAAEPPPEEPPAPTKAEQTEEKFEDNCAVIRETAKQCGSQTTPISHVDDEGRTWSMNCPVKDAHEARAYYYRLMAENAVYGGADSNPYYQKEDGPGHQPHNKTCCYGLHDGFQPEDPRYGFQASTRENFSKEKYSGTCGLQPTAGKSGSLSMLCNMGQTGGETQFRSCDVNVMPPSPPPPPVAALDDPNREYEKISPKVGEVSCETGTGTWYTGKAEFAVDGDPDTGWTCKGMATIGFDLGKKQVINAVNVQFGGSVSNGNYVKIYVDGKLVAEGIQGATSKRWDIDNIEGQIVTYETIAKPHNKWRQTAKWSEIGEITVEAGDR